MGKSIMAQQGQKLLVVGFGYCASLGIGDVNMGVRAVLFGAATAAFGDKAEADRLVVDVGGWIEEFGHLDALLGMFAIIFLNQTSRRDEGNAWDWDEKRFPSEF